MAAAPDLSCLLRELRPLTDWRTLGIHLRIPPYQLECIYKQYMITEGVSGCKAHMLYYWIQLGIENVWEVLTEALMAMGKIDLARYLRKKYIPGVAFPNATAVPKVQKMIRSSSEIVNSFVELESEFALLVANTIQEFERCGMSPVVLYRYATELLQLEVCDPVPESIDKVFGRLRSSYCCVNYLLLKDMINQFLPNTPSQVAMEEYVKNFDKFASSSKMEELIGTLITAASESENEESPGRSTVVVKLCDFWRERTLVHFQLLLQRLFDARTDLLSHIEVTQGCLCVAWLVQGSAIPFLLDQVEEKVNLLYSFGVIKLVIGDTTVFDNGGEDIFSGLDMALSRAVGENQLEAVEFLLSIGADPDSMNDHQSLDMEVNNSEQKWNHLMVASYNGQSNLVIALLDGNADVNIQSNNGDGPTALMLACHQGHLDIAMALVYAGTDLDLQDSEGSTALMLAASSSSFEIVELLIDVGANVDMADAEGNTALFYAVSAEAVSVAQLLVGKGKANVSLNNEMPLHFACFIQNVELVGLLLKNKANPNTRGDQGVTPLMLACTRFPNREIGFDPSILYLLLSYRADPNACNDNGDSPLMAAATYGYLEGVETLLDAKADVNLENTQGSTALFAAAQSGNATVVSLLLHEEALPDHRDHSGQTAGDLTNRENVREVLSRAKAFREKKKWNVEWLAEKGIDLVKTGIRRFAHAAGSCQMTCLKRV